MRVEPDPDNGVRILAGGKNLVLQGIQRKHNGNYTCTAYNLEGEDTSNAIAITVMCKQTDIRVFCLPTLNLFWLVGSAEKKV